MEQNSGSHSAADGPENKRSNGGNMQQSLTATQGRQGKEDSNQKLNQDNGDDGASNDQPNIAGGYDDNYDDQDRNEDPQGNYNYGGNQGDDNLNQSPAQDDSRNDSNETGGQQQDNDYENGRSYTGRNAAYDQQNNNQPHSPFEDNKRSAADGSN